ncbi:MAG: zinc-ribbon domain-containing protein [Beijerinckiaceae bacterium]
MDISCPTCEAVYEIDEATVSDDGRKVRCAACSTVWRVFRPQIAEAIAAAEQAVVTTNTSEERLSQDGMDALFNDAANDQSVFQSDDAKPDQAVADIQPENPEMPLESVPAPRRTKWTKDKPARGAATAKPKSSRAALAAIAATLVIVGVGIHQRTRIVQFLPQTARLYAAIGLPVNLRGIEIKSVASRMLDDNGVSVLVVDGDLQNTTNAKVDIPRLRFAVLGPKGQEVYVWSAQADRTSLQPGETLNFRRRLAAPPTDGKDVSVRFVTKSDITAGIK